VDRSEERRGGVSHFAVYTCQHHPEQQRSPIMGSSMAGLETPASYQEKQIHPEHLKVKAPFKLCKDLCSFGERSCQVSLNE